ncbi:DNA-processing protein DprA [Candidatus Bipolaricaulota bacterium]|nr:DNA-processing protein DprA [Candidatus Bipolaricaulota bacterium]
MNWTARHLLIGLNLIREITPRRMEILLHCFSSPQEIWDAPAREISGIPGFSAEVASQIVAARSDAALDCELARAVELGVSIVTLLDPAYPPLLREIEAPPAVLYIRGEETIDTRRTIAIVGTRRASGYGRAMAERLARDLGALGLLVVSGLALGIDTAAHRGALAAGGKTVAVLGSGFLHPYPAANRELIDRVAQGGAVVSEYPLDTHPTKWTFPQRNRTIAGLSRGVVVVEAPARSGALITARLALEQGREVFAVPGNVISTASAGTNRLIKDGAKLVEGTDDILNEFPDLATLKKGSPTTTKCDLPLLSAEQRRIYELVGLEPLHIDDIISRGSLSPTEAAHTLLLLQMKDLIQEVEGKRYIKRP